MEHKAELDNLFGQGSASIEKVETIVGDAVIKTKAELVKEYKEGKVDQLNSDEAIAAWAELEALAAAEASEVEANVGDKALVESTVEDARIEHAKTGQDGQQEGDDQRDN
ncbi:hypothetical protein ACOSQ2_010148 [Xanthoceras sorbifolium]